MSAETVIGWTRLPDAAPGRTLGPRGPLQCTLRVERSDVGGPERCAAPLGHPPVTWGSVVVWDRYPLVRGHEPWPETGELIAGAGGHIWYCDRGPLGICDRCGTCYSSWDGYECPALGPVEGPQLPSIQDFLAMERRLNGDLSAVGGKPEGRQ